jgi:chromosome segregation ATPase
MDLYSIDKVEVEHADVKTFLRVLFEGYLLGTCWTYAEAYDIMEAHAQRNPILSAEELSQEILYEREIVHLEAENAELRSKVKDLEQSTLSAQVRMSNAEVKVDDLTEENAILRAQLGEKHDDNCRLQRSLAEEHNKLKVALQLDSKEPEACITLRVRSTETQLERLTSMVETLWKERYDS